MRLHNKILLGYLALASLVAGVGAGSYVTINAIRGEFEPQVWQAFWWTAIEARDVADVAAELTMRPGTVSQ